ncbi:hypothetical protein EDD36DRAFT_447466 [Exophiala viscosa]|uniref:Uncharacterized protein n=1 Tax=Exophiala viscosa TaxID=2486360 RepID=A0AAN6DLS3_9EURO|nr:hypothetical protein EDD36DRAFT_447466 [Exophiala viscosa]
MKSHRRPTAQRPRLLGRRIPAISMPGPIMEHKFDPESGQVYSEAEVRFRRTKQTDWIGQARGGGYIKKERPVGSGARSLAHLAKIKVAKQFPSLTADHFASIPWSLAEQIWEELLSMGMESFHAWRILATAYPGPDEFDNPEYRYFIHIKTPSLPYTEYLTGITSESLNWLTCLRVSPQRMSTADLVAIHKTTNLAVLDLSDGRILPDIGSPRFDERVFRSWADLARNGQAFQHLRVLLFAWQDSLSDWIFKYVDAFPSLCRVLITDCPRMHQRNRVDWEPIAQAAGWEARHAKKSAKDLRPVVQGWRRETSGYVAGCYDESLELFKDLAHPRRPNMVERLPMLEVWLDYPRPWTHVVDDFPSTRTIWFDNTKTRVWKEQTEGSQVKNHEVSKRVRNQDVASQGSASPPPKRGTKTQPTMKSRGKNITDLLGEFQPR